MQIIIIVILYSQIIKVNHGCDFSVYIFRIFRPLRDDVFRLDPMFFLRGGGWGGVVDWLLHDD